MVQAVPSFILAASQKTDYSKLIDEAGEYGKSLGNDVDIQVATDPHPLSQSLAVKLILRTW